MEIWLELCYFLLESKAAVSGNSEGVCSTTYRWIQLDMRIAAMIWQTLMSVHHVQVQLKVRFHWYEPPV